MMENQDAAGALYAGSRHRCCPERATAKGEQAAKGVKAAKNDKNNAGDH